MNKFKKLSIPYLVWIITFTIIPLFLLFLFSISTITDFSVMTFKISNFKIGFSHFKNLFSNSFRNAFMRSMRTAFIATLGTLLIGYPTAYIISRLKIKNKTLVLFIFIIPMWTNMLLRIQTINDALRENSFLKNVFGFSIDLSNQKELKLIIVMILVYLPFMIFPIYTVLEKMDRSLLEASADLGTSPIKAFLKVTFPMSIKGVTSGIMMVFLPCAMGYTIPYIVSDGDKNYSMIGSLIERQFKTTYTNYNYGSLMSIVMIIFVLGSLYLISKIDAEGETLL